MAVDSRPVPSIPTPTIPKRTRSLAGAAWDAAGIGSASKNFGPASKEAPAAPAVACKNARRETPTLPMIRFLLGAWAERHPTPRAIIIPRRGWQALHRRIRCRFLKAAMQARLV